MSFVSRILRADPNRLSVRLLRETMFLSTFVIVLVCGFAGVTASLMMVPQESQLLRLTIASIVDRLPAGPLAEKGLVEDLEEALNHPPAVMLRVMNPATGEVVASVGMDVELPPEVFPLLGENRVSQPAVHPGIRTDWLLMATWWTPAADPTGRPLMVQAALDVGPDRRMLMAFILGNLVVGLMMLAAAGFELFRIVRRELQPLERIRAEVRALDPSDMARRIGDQDLPTELGQIVEVFNAALERQERSAASLSSYADNAAHELRRPVNRTRLMLTLALEAPDLPDATRDRLENAMLDLGDLNDTLERLLFLARAENTAMRITTTHCDIDREFEDISDLYQPLAEDRGITLVASAPAGLWHLLDRPLFRRAVCNLLDNALSHTPAGGRIDLRASTVDDRLQVEVSDTGDGIPADRRDAVFRRFWRADAGRSDRNRSGLGLPIARSIAQVHGGTASVVDRDGPGTTLRLVFGWPRQGAAVAAESGESVTGG